MSEFFLEIRCEEIPAGMLEDGMRKLATRIFEELMGRHFEPRSLETAFTPRRLVLSVNGLADREPDREEEVIGPPVAAAFDDQGQPKPAAFGFAKRCGVEVGELRRVRTEKGEYLGAVQKTGSRPPRSWPR